MEIFTILLYLINCYSVAISNSSFQSDGTTETKSTCSVIHYNHKVQCTFKSYTGSVIHTIAYNNKLSISGPYFTKNAGSKYGCDIYILGGTLVLGGTLPNIFTHSSARSHGGTIYCYRCILIFRGSNTFLKHSTLNSEFSRGGTLYVERGRLIMLGTYSYNTSSRVEALR